MPHPSPMPQLMSKNHFIFYQEYFFEPQICVCTHIYLYSIYTYIFCIKRLGFSKYEKNEINPLNDKILRHRKFVNIPYLARFKPFSRESYIIYVLETSTCLIYQRNINPHFILLLNDRNV